MNEIISHGAEWFLTTHRMQVIARDWRCCMGDADFVCVDRFCGVNSNEREQVVLVNLKFGLRPDDGESKHEEAARLRRIALFYMAMHPDVDSVRYDVITMDTSTDKITKQTVGTYQA